MRVNLKQLGAKIPLTHVTEWLRRRNWSLKPDGKGGLLCEGPPDDDGNPITCTLPQDESYGDYYLRLEDLIATLAILEDRPVLQILREMITPSQAVEANTEWVPPDAEALIDALKQSIGDVLSEEQWQGIAAKLSPVLANAVLAVDGAAPTAGNSLAPVALVAVRLADSLPSCEVAKLAIWRVCSRLLDRLALEPDELDAFYAVAVADEPDDPENTWAWLRNHFAQPENEEVVEDPKSPAT